MEKSKDTKMSPKSSLPEIFSDEEAFQRIFGECLENNTFPTSEAVVNYYQEMNGLFNKYLEAIQENMFRYAYQCGFNAALEARPEKKTKN